MNKLFENPYLPDRKVENIFISNEISDKIKLSLIQYGIKYHTTINCELFNISVSSHPDMLLCKIKNTIYIEKNNVPVIKGIESDFSGIRIIEYDFGEKQIGYPDEAALNGLYINNKLICNKKSFKPEQETHNTIYVKQGYTKCSLCVVDENSFITEDKGIYNELSKNDYDILYIEPGGVKLNGYDHGFIGGASGKIEKNILAFTGDITKHKEYKKIYEFTKSKGIECISLSDEPLYDYGSIIAIS